MKNKYNTILKWIHIWNSIIEFYLKTSEFLIDHLVRVSKYYLKNKNLVFHITFLGIVFVFFSVLLSCVSRRQIELPRKIPLLEYKKSNIQDIPNGSLYLKNEELVIKSVVLKSQTGSIWGDAPTPRSLYGFERIETLGEILDVQIPSEFRNEATGNQSSDIENIKMKIMGKDELGNLILKGGQAYKNEKGETRRFLVEAKVSPFSQNSQFVSAKDLKDIRVEESAEGISQTFVSTGWDKSVTRRVSGSAPDVKSATASLEAEKNLVQDQKKVLDERIQSLNLEKERLAKDRKRFEDIQNLKSESMSTEKTKSNTGTQKTSIPNNTKGKG